METNPYGYDEAVPWIPQPRQFEGESSHVFQEQYQQPRQLLEGGSGQRFQGPYQQRYERGQKVVVARPMAKVRAFALVRRFKRWLVVSSLLGFVAFGGLIAYHPVSANLSLPATPATSTPAATPAQGASSTSQNGNGFFQQQGGNNFGSSSTSQGPVSGSHAS